LELLTYKQLPRPMRQIASNTWVRELMYRLSTVKVSDFIRALSSFKGRELKSEYERRSNYWYLALKKRPVTRLHKVNEIEEILPNTKSVLDSLFWHFLLHTSIKNIKPKTNDGYNKYFGPTIDDNKLTLLAHNYALKQNIEQFDEQQLEQIHSVHGLAALLADNCRERYEGNKSEQHLKCIFRTFLITFAVRYQSDFVWVIFQLLQDHLADNSSPKLPLYFAKINSEKLLLEKIEQVREGLVEGKIIEKTQREKLIYLITKSTIIELF